MSSYRSPAEVFPPGQFILDELEAREWSQVDLAQVLGRTPAAVNELVSGKRGLTPETAQALSEAFGTSPELWLNLESVYRLSLAKCSDKDIARRAKLYDKAPVNEMLKRKWLKPTSNIEELEQQVFRHLEIESIDAEPQYPLAARKSTPYESTTPSQWAWFYRAKQLAASVDIAVTFDATMIPTLRERLRALTIEPIECRKLPKLLSEFGIRFVVVEALPKTKIDGVAFWVDQSPAIAVSLRYDRIDAFWHTVTHELVHVFNGDATAIDENLVGTEPQTTTDAIEQRTNEQACEMLIPGDKIESFMIRVRPMYSKNRIVQFANTLGIHPGLIVGQLQHRGEIGFQHSREMLVKIRGTITDAALTDGWGHFVDLDDEE